MNYLNVESELDALALLAEADDRVTDLLRDHEFLGSEAFQPRLTNAGRALAADFGLCFAQLLIANSNKIHWESVNSPRTDLSFNLPVLKGFGRIHLDPIRGAISHYSWLSSGHKPKSTWPEAFGFWLQRANA